MRLEVHSAADFLMNLLRVKQKQRNSLSENQLQNFKGSLADVLMRRYRSHWYPEVPHKGSGFRCIRINGRLDPLIEQAGSAVGLPLRALKKMLPHELTMWIDPDEVSYRIGENGSICVLYDITHHRASPASDLDSTTSSNGVGGDDYMVRSVDMSGVSNDLNGIMEEFFENSSARIVTKPKVQQHSFNNHNNHNARNTASLNNSLSSTSSGQLSPPLSPPFNHNQQHQLHQHQQHHHQFHQNPFRQQQQQQQPQQPQHRFQQPPQPQHHMQQQQQQQVAVQHQQQFNNHQFNYNTSNNNNNNNFMNETAATTPQQFYQWENSAFHSHHGNNNKGLLQAVR